MLAFATPAPGRGYEAGGDSAQDYNSAIALYNQGVAYANRGRLEQALAWFQRARAAARDDSLRADTDRRIAEVRGRLLIRQGVALFDAGKLPQARRKLAAALAYPLDSDEKAYARRFIREIDHLLKGGP